MERAIRRMQEDLATQGFILVDTIRRTLGCGTLTTTYEVWRNLEDGDTSIIMVEALCGRPAKAQLLKVDSFLSVPRIL